MIDGKTCTFASDLGHWAVSRSFTFWDELYLPALQNCLGFLLFVWLFSKTITSQVFKESPPLWMRSQLFASNWVFLQTIHFSPYGFVQAIFLSVSFLWFKGGYHFFFCKTHKCVMHKRAIDCKTNILKCKSSINITLL